VRFLQFDAYSQRRDDYLHSPFDHTGRRHCNNYSFVYSESVRERERHHYYQLIEELSYQAQRVGADNAYNSIPAIDADIRLAMVPASMARIPRRASSPFLLGASAPMPPI
jgi:hypothetical protein